MIPLHRAAMDGEWDDIRTFVFIRPESIKKMTSKDTALHRRALSDWRLDVYGENKDGNTVLHPIPASFFIYPFLEMQMLTELRMQMSKELHLAKRSNPAVMRVNSIRGQADQKVDLEWYNKDSGFENKRYFYIIRNKYMGFLKQKAAFNFTVGVAAYFQKSVAEVERMPGKKEASFRTPWLNAGTNYRRLVEPLDVAEYYKDYETNRRSQRYKKLEHSLGEAGKPLTSPVSTKKQNVSASRMDDSCFWANVEEYLKEKQIKNYAESPETKIHNKVCLSNKKNEDSNTQMHLTTLNKSIELTSTMAQEMQVKKLMNNLQAFPVLLVDTEPRKEKKVNSFLAETPDSSEAMVNAMEAGEFTAVNAPSYVLQSRSSFLANSHLKNNWPMKMKIGSGTNACHLLLLIAAIVSTITYHTALKIQACKSEQGCNYNSILICSLISICQIVDQHPLFIRLVMAFNSIAFFLSVALMMILFNELPLRPLLLVSAFSMLGAYICAISDLTKPT